MFPELGIPRRTALSWIRRGVGDMVSLDHDEWEPAFRQRVANLERFGGCGTRRKHLARAPGVSPSAGIGGASSGDEPESTPRAGTAAAGRGGARVAGRGGAGRAGSTNSSGSSGRGGPAAGHSGSGSAALGMPPNDACTSCCYRRHERGSYNERTLADNQGVARDAAIRTRPGCGNLVESHRLSAFVSLIVGPIPGEAVLHDGRFTIYSKTALTCCGAKNVTTITR